MGDDPVPDLDDFFVLDARYRESSHRERQLEAERQRARQRSARLRAEMDRGVDEARRTRSRKRPRRERPVCPTPGDEPSRRRKIIGWGIAVPVVIAAVYLSGHGRGSTTMPLGPGTRATACAGTVYPVSARYRFEWCAGAQPVGWGHCRTLTVATNPKGAPLSWKADIDDALAQLAEATGLRFHQRPAGPADITIRWLDPLAFPGGPAEDKAGLTRPEVLSSSTGARFVSAQIYMSARLTGGNGPDGEIPVLLHELAHGVGLGHFQGPEVMNPVDQGYPTYQSGDLAGLAALYRPAGCR